MTPNFLDLDIAANANCYGCLQIKDIGSDNSSSCRFQQFRTSDNSYYCRITNTNSNNHAWFEIVNTQNSGTYLATFYGCSYVTAPASSVTNSIVTTTGISKSSNGYVKFGNGIILQWGITDDIPGNGSLRVTYPTAFTSVPRIVATPTSLQSSPVSIVDLTTTSFDIDFYSSSNTSSCRWIAIGY